MHLDQRTEVLVSLGKYLNSYDETLERAKLRAEQENPWFVKDFISLSINNICEQFLAEDKLKEWVAVYQMPQENPKPQKIGIVMAGNIPLVGFHDFLCAFITGNHLVIKASSKDAALIKHLVQAMTELNPAVAPMISFADQLKACDAYIATGSNNTSRYFEYYFRNYPSIIRKNRTSVAIINGNETEAELHKLADDILLYFGLGCRNVSKLYVPKGYDFMPLLAAFENYRWMADHSKFKNNYDYNLSLHILNNKFYMTNGIILLVEQEALFSPISQVNFEYYDTDPSNSLAPFFKDDIQCLVGSGRTRLGNTQSPRLTDYADGVDTMAFMLNL